jgi:hypothetical protein
LDVFSKSFEENAGHWIQQLHHFFLRNFPAEAVFLLSLSFRPANQLRFFSKHLVTGITKAVIRGSLENGQSPRNACFYGRPRRMPCFRIEGQPAFLTGHRIRQRDAHEYKKRSTADMPGSAAVFENL